MEKTPFFTVIMPVYNVENYVETAVESVLCQSFSDFELLLIDDCSPDKSGEICDSLAAKDARIRVVHLPQNGGLSHARNTGLDMAVGEYIAFMDSDDVIDTDTLQSGYTALQKNSADAVVFGMREEYFDAKGVLSKTYFLAYGQELYLDNLEQVHREIIHLEEKTLYGYACNKFYRRDAITSFDIRFQNIPLIEDILFNIDFFEHAVSLNVLNTTPYCYKKRIDGSLTNRFVPDYFVLHRRRVQEIAEQYKRWDMYDDSVRTILAAIYARYIFSALQRNCDSRAHMNTKQRKAFLFELFDDSLFEELADYMPTGNSLIGILATFLKKKRVNICLLGGRVIYIVKTKLPVVFAKAKQSR
ncbi:MAG: glycosyltransferase family 2 protein [Clostridia bacterium]|nr:glycosyltransferase family 2 protein [Clostridia bacterium]